MTQDDIFELAEKAGFHLSSLPAECGRIWWSDECPLDEELLRFAALVAAAERKACARMFDEREAVRSIGEEMLGAIRARWNK